MNRNHALWTMMLLLVTASLLLTACGGGSSGAPTDPSSGAPVEPSATPDPASLFPTEMLPLADGATDIKITEAANSYSYVMPGLVQDCLDTLGPKFEELGWKKVSNPMVMGHLATMVMENDQYRMTVNLQDNERSNTTTVQMNLQKK